MPRAATKPRKPLVPTEVKEAVKALPPRNIAPRPMVSADQVVARQAANDALCRKLFAKPAKAAKSR